MNLMTKPVAHLKELKRAKKGENTYDLTVIL